MNFRSRMYLIARHPRNYPSAGLGTVTYGEDFEEEAHDDIAGREEQAQDEGALTSLGGFMDS